MPALRDVDLDAAPPSSSRDRGVDLNAAAPGLSERKSFRALERTAAATKDFRRAVPHPVVVVVAINGHPARALLDSGSLADFMSHSLADQLRIQKMELAKPLPVQLAVQGSRSKINWGVKAQLKYQTIKSERYFDLINLQNYDLILGTPFLFQHQILMGLNPPKVVVGSAEPLPLKGDGVRVLESR
ncbi:hypothetical protein NEOLEDRAFT_1058935, partial [Neolentinus lepideus HHB14362 ss-1]